MVETNGFIAEDIIEDIEDAIRRKLGSSEDYPPPVMADAIMSIPQTINGKLIEKDITDNGPYEAEDDNADGYSKVNVNVKKEEPGGKILPVLTNLNASSNGTYDPADEGADGYNIVNVQVPGGGSNLTEETILENGVFDPPAGYDGFSKVNVQVYSEEVNIGEKETPITENGVYESQVTDNKDGYSKVTVQIPLENSKSVTITGDSEILPSPEFTAMKKVNVSVPIQEEKTVTQNGNVYPDGNNIAIKKVIVEVPTSGGVVGEKDISQNGTYHASDDNLDGYDVVNVNVPQDPPNLETRSETTTSQTTYTPSPGYDGIGSITINPAPPLEEKSVTLTSQSATPITPSSGKYGMSKVTVTPKMETKSITQNGTYTPTTGNVGFSSVSVQVSGGSLQDRTITLQKSSSTANPLYIDKTSTSYYGLNRVTLYATRQDKTATSGGVIYPDSSYYGLNSVNVPIQGETMFTSNGVYSPTSPNIGFSKINIQVPSGPQINLNNVIYYQSGSKNIAIEPNRACVGGYPTFGFDYSSAGWSVHIGNAIVDASHMFEGTNINSLLDRRNESGSLCYGGFYDYSYMFNGCTLFNSGPPFLEINNAMNMEKAFCGCENYDYSAIYLDTTYPGYTNVSAASMFENCKKLFSAEISINMSIQGLYNTSNMFKNCEKYSKSINFPNCIKDASHMFDGCTTFDKNIIFNQSASYRFGTSRNLSFMFNNCVSFNSWLNNATDLGAISFYRMFHNCIIFNKPVPNLYSATPSLDTSRMFENCYKFNQKINIFTGLTFINMENMFINCNTMNSYVNIYIRGYANTSIVTPFRGCNNFKSNVYILKSDGSDIQQNGAHIYSSGIYNRNISASTQPYRMNILCGSTNIYNAFLRDMYSPPTWTSFSDGVYNTKYNVYVYNHI